MRPSLAAFLAALPLLALTACGSGSDDKSTAPMPTVEEWKSALAETGFTAPDWERYSTYVKTSFCKMDSYEMFVTLSGAEDALSFNQQRIGLEHACPGRVKDWDAAILNLSKISDRTDFLCETPLEELSADAADGEISDQEEALIVCDQYQTSEWEQYYDEHFAP